MDKTMVTDMFANGMAVDEILTQANITQSEFDSLNLIPQNTSIDVSLQDQIEHEYLTTEKSLGAISRQLKVSISSIYRVLSDRGIELRKVVTKSSDDLRKEMVVSLYKAGKPYWFIQQETGYSNGTVTTVIRKSGTKLRQAKDVKQSKT